MGSSIRRRHRKERNKMGNLNENATLNNENTLLIKQLNISSSSKGKKKDNSN